MITGTVTLNGGDAAILLAEDAILREAAGEPLEISIFDSHPGAARKYYPMYDFRLSLLVNGLRPFSRLRALRPLIRGANYRRFLWGVELQLSPLRRLSRLLLSAREVRDLSTFARADVIAFTGGMYLVENYSLRARFFDMELARRLQKTVLFLPQSMGPFTTNENRHIMGECLAGADLVLLRDARSRSYVLDLVPDHPNAHVVPDMAFGLKVRDPMINGPGSTSGGCPADSRLRVAVSVRAWPFFKTMTADDGMRNLMRVIAAAVTELVSTHDASLVFISTCQGVPEYWTDDSRVAQDICCLLPNELRRRVTIDTAFHDPRDLAEKLRGFDFAITTRMHAAMLSMVAGTPVLPIAYEFKTNELFASMGLAEWVSDIETIREDDFVRLMGRFIERLPQVGAATVAAVKRQQEALEETTRLLGQALQRGAEVAPL